MGEKILVVDDEREIADLVAVYLQNEDYTVYRYYTAEEALDCIRREELDLAVLDVMLPGMSGFEICQKIREHYNYPVIMLTAKDAEVDKITGLTLGADDYITKPFSLAVLRARVATQLRRVREQAEAARQTRREQIIVVDEYRFDFERMEYYHGDEQVELSRTEQKLLRVLVDNRGISLTRERLLERIWSSEAEFVDENALSVTVKRLRDKLGAQDRIKTVYGVGYRFE